MANVPKFPQLEEDILKYWDEKGIFHKTLAKPSPKGDFVFFEGPPTANGKPGLHHILARAFKDVIPRFRTMQGYHVERKAGWDTHGLPVELQVEKTLGISGKPDIEKYGISEFNMKCKESVWQYKDEWEKMTKRMAFWLDLEHPYVTYSKEYIETLWWILKETHRRGLLYEGHKVVPHCPRCGTALSSHEVAQGYKEVEDESVYVKFAVKGEEKTFILSWTTTPWTLPGNVALAVGKDIVYSKVKVGDEIYILAKELLDDVFEGVPYEVLESMRGENLEGVEYESLFPDAIDAGGKRAWYVTAAGFVTTEDGTGVVHTAVMYGEDDYNLGEEKGLPKVHTVDENGKFLPGVTKWSGKFVKSKTVEQGIISDLKERGLLFRAKMYRHEYPFCWRCDTPLLYYAKNSWFIRMSALREELVKRNKNIHWVPAYIKQGRFGEWLEGAKDWAISRERYWGTPLPIWQNNENPSEIVVVGSYAELETLSGKKFDKNFDPHRPLIDEITFPALSGKGTMRRVKMVADCWFDSGSMPFAQHHYPFENKELIESGKAYPADYICEAIDQTRGWFYTLLSVATILGKEVPYKNVICLGHINDKEGKKMSKSRGNIVDPWKVFDAYGADALRLHLYTLNQPGDTKNYDEKDTADAVRKYFVVLWNVLNFYGMYAGKEMKYEAPEHPSNILDRWVLAKLDELIRASTGHLEAYELMEAARKTYGFINDLSTWYVRRSRDRFKEEGKDKTDALGTLRHVLITLSKLMAPFTPLVSEGLYRELGGEKESVHLEEWPKAHSLEVGDVLNLMEETRRLIELGLAIREASGLKVRQALEELVYEGIELDSEYETLAADELNVKTVRSEKGFSPNAEYATREEGGLKAALKTTVSDALKKEGYIRELTRQLNSLRKEQKLTIEDRVEIIVATDDTLIREALKDHTEALLKSTLGTKLSTEKKEVPAGKEVSLDGKKVWIGIVK